MNLYKKMKVNICKNGKVSYTLEDLVMFEENPTNYSGELKDGDIVYFITNSKLDKLIYSFVCWRCDKEAYDVDYDELIKYYGKRLWAIVSAANEHIIFLLSEEGRVIEGIERGEFVKTLYMHSYLIKKLMNKPGNSHRLYMNLE